MKFLENVSIQKRLIGALVIWMIILIGFGTLAIIKLQELALVTQKIYDYPLQLSNSAKEVRVDIIKIHREMRDVILSESETEIQSHIDVINSLENRVYQEMDVIKDASSSGDVKSLEMDIRSLLTKWKKSRQDVINLSINGEKREALILSQDNNSDFVGKIEEELDKIDKLEGILASDLITDAHKIQNSQKSILLLSLLVFGLIAVAFFTLIARSIIVPIAQLKAVMKDSVTTDDLLECSLQGKNELVDMSENFNALIYKLRSQFWIKDGQNKLSQQTSGNYSLKELTQRVINFLGEFLEAGNGVFYLYNEKDKTLRLNSAFAFTERNILFEHYAMGQGIVGQVALERKPILLRNIKRQDALIRTGIISEPPLNLYAFPLIHEDKLYGVIEISSFQPFTDAKQEFLKESSRIIAINLFSVIQNEKIKTLLEESEEAKGKIQITAEELQKANTILEEQQILLQQQTEELQKTNAELEEQQQLLQQQSEELQQTNSQLEEQQQMLEEQSKVLNTQNRELESSREELISRSNELEITNKYKSEFLANMSHELRTPLNSIILLSKLLITNQESRLSKEYIEKISIIHSSGNELLRLINDILDLSKIEAGRMNLNITKFHSNELLQNLKNLFGEVAEEKNVQLIIKDSVDKELKGDRDKISQILRNLLSNSLKFTNEGSVKLIVDLDEYKKDIVVFSVIDTGIGIRYEQIQMIFEEFQQGDGSISRKYGGTGLGLSISKKLAEFMGGCIEVNSQLGVGSEFKLILPGLIDICATREEIKVIPDDSSENIGEGLEEESAGKSDRLTLLLEKNLDFITSVKNINQGLGFNTVVAANVEEGNSILKKCKVDGIIVNLALLSKEELQRLKALRNSNNKEIPIIAYTDKELEVDEERKVKRYFDSVILKTFNSDERLIDEITLFLHKVRKNNKENGYLVSRTDREYALNLKGKKILIVDDDPRNIFVLASALEDFEGEVLDAENGKIAIEKLKKNNVDLILMDIMMPVMDGYEAIKTIRKDEKLKDIPIIALTAKSLKEDRAKCIEVGADDYISKPVDYDIFIRLVKAWISKKL
ncbi:response regulator [Clostridium sp. A1-XYC3]|uniref:Stage 0 sporulation protein A homolog n=1 Tax=Clostridium tanneri TaxID=3037988 RepID=A0ABU4JSQ1_9CLOT|nr:response regulator [Clostridium sp. A1-XYC3]MDW8801174.1 response regulator [Clostridium sp. A1-XYC3]